MARGCWTALLIVAVVIIVLLVVVGPTVYREGRAIAGPIAQMARSEGEIKALDSQFPFTPPEGHAVISEQRLQEFLGIRRELLPLYVSWQDTVANVERQHGDSWTGAKPVLAATRDVMKGQIAALRGARMSPGEFRWLEDVVYTRWRSAQTDAPSVVQRDAIRQVTEEDLEILSQVERRHGRDPALADLRRRLEQRLSHLSGPSPMSVPGISPATQELLWSHRDVIDELDLADYELHAAIDRQKRTTFTVGDRRLEFAD